MKYRSRPFLSFIDFLFILLLSFISMFILALLLINPVTKKSDVDRKAEYIIILEWDNESNDDVDIWVEDPGGNVLSFRQKSVGLMHLDKDDLGQINDIIMLPDGETQIIKINREVATLRGWITGEYIINVHMYTKRSDVPTSVDITMMRINPYRVLFEEQITLNFRGEEHTIRRITLNANGDMIETSKEQKRYVNTLDRSSNRGWGNRPTHQRGNSVDRGVAIP